MKILLSALFFLFLSPAQLFAAWHLYVTTVIGTGTAGDEYRPNHSISGIPYKAIYFGREGVVLVATDVTTAQDTALQGFPDVVRLPDNLDQQVGTPALSTVRGYFESRNLPGNWIQASTTYRTILTTTVGIFQLMNRFAKISHYVSAFLTGSVTLSTTFGSLSQTVRDNLLAAATQFNIDTSGLTGSATLRQIFQAVGPQIIDKIGGIKIGPIQISSESYSHYFRRKISDIWDDVLPSVWAAILGSDNFNRTDRALDGSWTQFYSDSSWLCQIVSEAVTYYTGAELCAAFYSGFTAPDDQYAQVVLRDFSAPDNRLGVILRATLDTDFYRITANSYAGGTRISYYSDSGGLVTLAEEFVSTWANNDVLKAQVVGTGIEVFKNGASVDTSPPDGSTASGQPGVWLSLGSGTETAALDDFVTGDLATGVVVTRHRAAIVQ